MGTIVSFGNSVVGFGSSGVVVGAPAAELPAKTLRCSFRDGFNPIEGLIDRSSMGMTWTHVTGDTYDFKYENTNWVVRTSGTVGGVFNAYYTGNVYPMTQHEFDIIDSNLSGVTDISYLLTSAWRCTSCVIKHVESVTVAVQAFGHGGRNMYLTSINDLYMPAVTNTSSMFVGCTNLASLPFVTAPLTVNTSNMFSRCSNVSSGITEMYEYLSTKPVEVTNHGYTFTNCGTGTAEGRAARASIPTSWGGAMAE